MKESQDPLTCFVKSKVTVFNRTLLLHGQKRLGIVTQDIETPFLMLLRALSGCIS
jgi:hypothetical protein